MRCWLVTVGVAFLAPAGCGGRAEEVSHRAASGGTISSGASESGGGSAGAAGSNASDACGELAEEAQNAFESEYLPGHRTCAVDADCVLVPGASCVGWCGYFVNQTSVAGLDAAIEEYCSTFAEAGCVAKSFPCLTITTPHLPVTCQAGACTPTPPG